MLRADPDRVFFLFFYSCLTSMCNPVGYDRLSGPSLIIYPKSFHVKSICRQLETLSPRLFASCKTLALIKDPLNGQWCSKSCGGDGGLSCSTRNTACVPGCASIVCQKSTDELGQNDLWTSASKRRDRGRKSAVTYSKGGCGWYRWGACEDVVADRALTLARCEGETRA